MRLSRRSFLGGGAALGAVGLPAAFAAAPSLPAAGVRFGVLSDTHVTGPSSVAALARALAALRDLRVDAVLHCGDITDFGYVDTLKIFAQTWRRIMPADVRLIAALGNRDFSDTTKLAPERRAADRDRLICADPQKALTDVLGIEGEVGLRGTVVKGVPVVSADWRHQNGLEDFLMAHPAWRPYDRPFVCIQHPHPDGTVFGLGTPETKCAATCFLRMFPKAWSFSGHSHRPYTLAGSLWRGDFTAAAAGSFFTGSGYGGYGREVSVLTVRDESVTLERRDLRTGESSLSTWFGRTPQPDAAEGSVFVQWNVGHFCHGRGAESDLTPDRAAATAAAWRRTLDGLKPELVGVCEWSSAFDAEGNSAREAVFGTFGEFVAGTQRGYQCHALAGRAAFTGVREHDYARHTQKTYALIAETVFANVPTTVVETHLDFADTPTRTAQIAELLELVRDRGRVIVSGDFNVSADWELLPFVRAGFRSANAGAFGTLPTHRRRQVGLTPAIDNVLVKGFDIVGVSLADVDLGLSDHRALVCRLRAES